MSQICLLIAVFVLTSVIGQDIDNKRQEDSTPAAPLCGRRPGFNKTHILETGRAPAKDSSDDLDKILGGRSAAHGEVPWIVNILLNGRPRCAGAIINKFWILTSASCVFSGLDANYTAVVGDNSFNSEDTGQQRFGFAKTVFNGLYGGSIDYDLALVKVNGSGIEFNDYVQPICLPVEGENKAAGRLLRLSGWGYQTELLTQHPGELRTIVVRVMSLTHCATFFYPGLVTERVMCVKHGRGQGDACKGDHGGPVTFQSGETHILSGIVSASITGCTVPSEGIVLSNILSYKNWIEGVINNRSNDKEKVIPSRNV